MVWAIVTTPSPSTAPRPDEAQRRRGPVLGMLRELLDEGENDAVVELFTKLVAHNEALLRKVAELADHRKKGEGVSSAQLKLLLDELRPEQDKQLEQANTELREEAELDNKTDDNADGKGQPERQRRQPRLRQAPPANLRRVDNPIAVSNDQRPCPVCGAERTCIGHDVSEVVELIPAELVVRVDRREKLACTACEGQLVRAPQGDKVVSGGKFGCTLVANLLVDKYRDGLPLNRQKQRFAHLGLPVSISTLADQVMWSTDLLRPLWRALSVMVLNSAVMQLDGTGLVVRDKKHPNNKKLGTLWGYIGDQLALYLYTSTGKKTGQRPGELGPEDFLKLRSGYTVADAANLFDKSFLREDLIECGCNMHARRYFKKALDAGDKRVALVIGAFKKLYDIEAQVRGKPPDEILAARQKQSAPIFDKLVNWCEVHKPHVEPRSTTGAAIRYLINHQLALRRFLEHGAIPMDNGAVERLHIRVALTRKAFLFAGSDAGAERAAIAYSILGCCALADVDPVAYLADVLPRLARGIRLRDAPDLLPHAWNTARA
jgi:transposase